MPSCTARVAVSLASAVPESVASLSISVVDLDRARIAASATVAASQTTIDLELPAETPLELRVVARTARPGSPAFGTMPAYFGSTVRTIPLGDQLATVALALHRAGGLSLTALPPLTTVPTRLVVTLQPESSAARPVSFAFDPKDPPIERSFILTAGRYTLVTSGADPSMDSRPVQRAPGLFIAPEIESVGRLEIKTATRARSASAPASLDLELLDDRGAPFSVRDVIPIETSRAAPFEVRARALDGAGGAIAVPNALVHVTLEAVPSSISVGSVSADSTALPSTLRGFSLRGAGRLVVRAEARLQDGSTIAGALAANAIPLGVMPGPAEKLVLRVLNPDQLADGTGFEIDLVDGTGLFAQAQSGSLDLSRSDPWAYLPGGPGGDVTPLDRGHLVRRIARPTGPRGVPVIVRATLTSTSIPASLSSTIALPLVEVAR